MNKVVDLTGQVFGRLTVVSMVRGRNTKVVCKCTCGGQVTALAYNVRNGNTKSCGCLSRETRVTLGKVWAPVMGAMNTTHGMTRTRTYIAWLEARKRCHRPQNKRYPLYGGRGIEVCERWRHSFEAFLADMGECPPGWTLERLDNDKGYEPGNCVWATKEEQVRNRRVNRATADIVRAMRAEYAGGASRKSLAARYEMSLSNVEAIVMRRTWANVN